MTKTAIPLNQQLCFALYSANNEMGRLYRPLLTQLGITYPQYLVLLALWEKDAQSVGALGKALFLESNTLTPLLKRMEAAGLLKRRRSLEDERSVMVTLTEKGRALEAQTANISACVGKAVDERGLDIEALREQIQQLAVLLRNFPAN